MEVTFRPVTGDDLGPIARWLAEPHVARWWAHETSPQAVERDFGPTLRGEEPNEDLVGSPDDVGRGLGSALVRALADDTLATRPGCGQLLVPVVAAHTASQRVLEKAGFVFVTVARAAPDNPVDPPEQRVYRRLRS